MHVVYAHRYAAINATDCMNASAIGFFGVADPPW
jgi:hypothetical protein